MRDRAAAAGVAPFTPHDMRRTYISELLDAGADLATVQKMVGHESVTTTAGYDRRGDAAKRKAADLVHVPFPHDRPEQAVTESIATRASCRKPAPYDQVTMLERTLVSGCRPKRVRSLFGAWTAPSVLVDRYPSTPLSDQVQVRRMRYAFLPQCIAWAHRIGDTMDWSW